MQFKHDVVGMLRIKNEERWIQRVVQSILPVCRTVIVFDDNSIDSTVDILSRFPSHRVCVVPTPFMGLNESRDKDFLLNLAIAESPDFILAVDGDEELEVNGPAKISRWLDQCGDHPQTSVYSFPIAYLWNSERQVRSDGIYGRFTRPSMFRIKTEDRNRLKFTRTNAPHNLHCSNFPQGLRGGIVNTDIRLRHYGYLHLEDRQRKYNWYNSIDPGSVNEDGYKHIVEAPSIHAPGPTQFIAWED